MENWRDTGIVLSVRAHGESGAIVSLLTEGQGRHAGYVRGIGSSRLRGVIEPGNLVNASWSSRVSDHLGNFTIEPERAITGPLMGDPLRLSALISACSLCDSALPERESHPALFYGLLALLDTLEGEAWGASYLLWEIAFMREMGFGLDLAQCAAGGSSATLAYVSPKSGRAVSREKGGPYHDRLLPLPDFLRPGGSDMGMDEILRGLTMTSYFLEHWVFAQSTKGVPEPRIRFQDSVKSNIRRGQQG